MIRRFLMLAVLVSLPLGLASAPAEGRSIAAGQGPDGHEWCGSDAIHTRVAEATAKHELFERRAIEARKVLRAGPGQVAVFAPKATRDGDIVIIEDDGSLVAERNLFDFANHSVRFLKKKSLLRAKATTVGIKQDLGTRIEDGDWNGPTCNPDAPADDDAFLVKLPFKVKYFGTKYDQIWVNTDGLLTFDRPDCSSSSRSLQRLLNGPPAIAGFFADLDPGTVSGERGVFVKMRPNNVQVTWNRVPEFDTSNSNTFQITVFRTGKIDLAFGDIDGAETIIGASPGAGSAVEFVDLTEDLPVDATSTAIVERYGLAAEVDDFGVAHVFFDNFADDYDHVTVFLDFPASLGAAFAYEVNIKNDVQGIGLGQFDFTDLVGSKGRLESFVQMGFLSRYPDNPHAVFLGTNSSLDVMGQEAGHRWLAFMSAEVDGQATDEVLGRDQAHWSFFFDSDESVMEGNDIMDLGGGNFQTIGATSRYSALDQYVMGLMDPADVGPMFLVRDGSDFRPESPPAVGRQFTGTRVDLTIDDFIAANGARVPAHASAKKTFRMAFVLLARQGQRPSRQSIDKLQNLAREWVKFFKSATDGNGKVDVKIR